LVQRKWRKRQSNDVNNLGVPGQWISNNTQINPQNKRGNSWLIIWIIFAIFALLFVVSIVMSGFEQSNTATDYFNRAADSFNSKDYSQALSYSNKSIECDSNYAMAYELRGFVYNNLGEFNQAIAEFNQSIACGLNDAIIYCERGKAYMSLNETEQAIADFQKCLILNPDSNTINVAQTNLQKLGVTIDDQ
jgi:tetratricopeptide (TPR) repeat protein